VEFARDETLAKLSEEERCGVFIEPILAPAGGRGVTKTLSRNEDGQWVANQSPRAIAKGLANHLPRLQQSTPKPPNQFLVIATRDTRQDRDLNSEAGTDKLTARPRHNSPERIRFQIQDEA